jgi:DNA-binding MarR family transcriptional regulator
MPEGVSLADALRRAARELERLHDAELSRTRARLRPAYVPVVAALLEQAPLTPGELCRRCDIEPSTMTGLLRTLEKRGLVEREKVVLDQRTQHVRLTPRGKAGAKVAMKARKAAEAAVLQKLPKVEADAVRPLLARVADAARALAEAEKK